MNLEGEQPCSVAAAQSLALADDEPDGEEIEHTARASTNRQPDGKDGVGCVGEVVGEVLQVALSGRAMRIKAEP